MVLNSYAKINLSLNVNGKLKKKIYMKFNPIIV